MRLFGHVRGAALTVGGASFERRTGHVRLLLPSVPCDLQRRSCRVGAVFRVGDSIGEVEERGLPCGVQLREGQHPEVEAEARAMA